jgi:hypothetical protein
MVADAMMFDEGTNAPLQHCYKFTRDANFAGSFFIITVSFTSLPPWPDSPRHQVQVMNV